MAAVPITIVGVQTNSQGVTEQVTIIGMATLNLPSPGEPPQIWGPNDPRPSNPIPIYPGGTPNPPGMWGGGNVPMPTPPIANVPGLPNWPTFPDMPTEPPVGEPGDDCFIKAPPEDGGWGYHHEYGWLYKPKAGEPGPKK